MPLIKFINDWNRKRLYARKRQRVRESYRVWLKQEWLHYPIATAHPQTIMLLLDTRDADSQSLQQWVLSLLAQSQQNWLAYFLTDSCVAPERLKQLQSQVAPLGRRVRWMTEAALEASSPLFAHDAGHEWVAFMDVRSIPAPGALATVLHQADLHPQARLMYSDHDHMLADDLRCVPHFKPDLNPEMLLSWNYIGNQFYVHRDVLQQGGWPEAHNDTGQRYALLLELTARLARHEIHHIPQILHHVKCEGVHTGSQAEKWLSHRLSSPRELSVVQAHLNRHHPGAQAHLIQGNLGVQIEFPMVEPFPKVSIIIPTRNAHHLFKRCIRSLMAITDYPHYEIWLVDNGSDDPEALAAFTSLEQDPRVKVLRDDGPFNFSALNNRAARHAQGDLLLLLNNDTEFSESGWLREMVALAIRPEIGCVGAKLYYPDGGIQHVGLVTGICGVATHVHVKMPGDASGHFNRAILLHAVSVVTGACLMVRRELYEQLGGLNEDDLAVAYNDVDFCLRVQQRGLRNVITPFAKLIHHESATRGSDSAPQNAGRFRKEVAYMKRVWGHQLEWDPAYNPNLSLRGSNFEVAHHPRRPR